MSNIKYCPECQKENDVNATKCECGYEFVIKEVEDEIASTNTIVFVDRVPQFLWKLVGFFCPIAGLVLYILWKKKWPERSKNAGKFALTSVILTVVVIALTIFVVVGLATGDIV